MIDYCSRDIDTSFDISMTFRERRVRDAR